MTLLYYRVVEIADRFPDRPALHVDGTFVSYGELCALSEGIAAGLRREGLDRAGVVIGLPAARRLFTYAGLLGILGSGNAYAPISPRWPDARIYNVCAQAGLAAVLLDAGTERRLAAALTDALPDAHGLTFEAGKLGTAYLSVSPSKVRAYAQNAEYAYLMFTSGTTGTPKGIAVTHANITACLDGAKGALPLFPEDRFSQMADIAFDVSVGEMFLCWTSGACLYVPTTGQSINPYRFIKDNRLTIWSSVPSVVRNLKRLDALEPRSFSCIRLALFCGEALPYSLARAWREAAHESAVINLYGPTEATIFATIGRWDGAEHDGGTVPIGTALPGMATRVEAEDGAEAAVGELLLSGPQLVSGYWNNEPATRRAFVTDEAGTTWYRTGDAVSADSQHGLIFRGRLDSQVKCRGFRIDLHEVEQVVARAIGSGFAVVVPVQNSDGLCESLVAFCDQPLEESASRKHCAEELPGYMVPSRIIQISDFPLMANGKIDRQRLTNLANCLR